MAEDIINNFVFLVKNLTSINLVLIHCVEHKIITIDDKDRIMAGETSLDKNDRFFQNILKKNWKDIKMKIVKILRETSNEHCADKIEGKETHPNMQTFLQLQSVDSSHQMSNSEERKTFKVLDSQWWPEKKKLPKAFLERKQDDKKLIVILKEYLTNSKNKTTVINQGAAVSGMGGVGKTTIAKWFALNSRDFYDHTIWIDCGEENLLTSFIDLAEELKIDSTLRLNTLSKKCFSKLEKARCLFIFDNAECYLGNQGIREVLPNHENFHTIITSRTKEWGNESGDGEIPQMHLDAFATKDSVEFLTKNLNDKRSTKSQLETLSKKLGNLPLALQIAVATINKRNLSISEYIERIKTTDQIINVNFDDYEKTINKTMKISLDIIKNLEEDPKQTAHKILLILGYIKPDFVNIKLIELVEGLTPIETRVAIELLEKYSLVTIHLNQRTKKTESCSIHRLLQQVIRHNNKDNEQVTLKKILSVEGFLGYKLLPYLHADKEIQNLFPKVKAQLIDYKNLETVLQKREFKEALEISRMIKNTLNTPMADYNYAVCLEKMDELTEAQSVLQAILNHFLKEENKSNKIEYFSFAQQLKVLQDRIDDNVNEDGLWDLKIKIEPDLVKGLLFLVYSRLGLNDAAHVIINEDQQLITCYISQSLDYVIKYLKSSSSCNYKLQCENKFIFLKLGNNFGKEIDLYDCSLGEVLPSNLDYLNYDYANFLFREPFEIGNLKSLSYKCNTSNPLGITGTFFGFCNDIILVNCVVNLTEGPRSTPIEINLEKIKFMRGEEEVKNCCLNDWIDFQKTKILNLEGSNMSMKLDKSLSINKIFLDGFNGLDWNDFNCTVKEMSIYNTIVPIVDQNIELRVDFLCLSKCSVHLKSLFFLTQSVKDIVLEKATIEIDEVNNEKKFRICAAEVELQYVKITQDPVEVTEILLNDILDLTQIKSLLLWDKKGTKMTFDMSQQFSLDELNLKRINLINFDKSTSSVKDLTLWNYDVFDVSSTQFRVTESLNVNNSHLNVTSLDNLLKATNKVTLDETSIHLDCDLGKNNAAAKSHYLNGQIKEVEVENITFFKDGKEIEKFLVNDFINISDLNSLVLVSKNGESGRMLLDMKNISLSLDTLELHNIELLNWDKGEGHVNEMILFGIPFLNKNNIQINYLSIEDASIKLSCLPKTIQRLDLNEGSVVICNAQIPNSLNGLCFYCNPSNLKYFSGCANLTKLFLGYSHDYELRESSDEDSSSSGGDLSSFDDESLNEDEISNEEKNSDEEEILDEEENSDDEYEDVNENNLLLNFKWLPKSIKAIKLNWKHKSSPPLSPLTLSHIYNWRQKVETVIIRNFLLSQVKAALDVLQPSNVIFAGYPIRLTNTELDIVTALIKSNKSLAIGKFVWESDEQFKNCPLAKFVDEKGEYYVIENQRGIVVKEIEFTDMTHLF